MDHRAASQVSKTSVSASSPRHWKHKYQPKHQVVVRFQKLTYAKHKKNTEKKNTAERNLDLLQNHSFCRVLFLAEKNQNNSFTSSEKLPELHTSRITTRSKGKVQATSLEKGNFVFSKRWNGSVGWEFFLGFFWDWYSWYMFFVGQFCNKHVARAAKPFRFRPFHDEPFHDDK